MIGKSAQQGRNDVVDARNFFSTFQRVFLKFPAIQREQSDGSRQALSSSLRKNVHSLAISVPALENMLPSAFAV
jgi:hypothetical protein